MPGSKKTAYEKAQLESEGKARLSLSDLAGELMKANARSDEKPKPQNTPEENIRQSAQTYGQITQQLNDFYKPPKEQESRKLEEKVDELLAKLKTQEQLQDERSRQEQMMERSYQMAAKYLNQGTAAEQSVVVAPPQPKKKGGRRAGYGPGGPDIEPAPADGRLRAVSIAFSAAQLWF